MDGQQTPPREAYAPRKINVPNAPGCSLWQLGETTYSLRWRDGMSRKQVGKRRSGLTEKHAKLWALKQATRNRETRAKRAEQKLEAELYGKRLETEGEQHTIEAEIREYYTELARPENRSRDTLANAEEALFMFLEWCNSHGYKYLAQLNAERLKAYWTGLRAMRQRNGNVYKVSSINQWLKYPRTVLRKAAGGGHAPHLNSDILRENLKHTKIAKRKDRNFHGIKTPKAHTPAEISRLIHAALARDAAVGGDKPVAYDLTMLLLDTFRRREYTYLKCSAVNERDAYRIELPPELGKGFEDRKIALEGVTDIGQVIAAELVRGRAPDEWVSVHEYYELGRALDELVDYGAPKTSPHLLRATCVTYQLGVAGLNPKQGTERAGHSMQIADADYYDPPADMLNGAPTIEASMRCEFEFIRVFSALRRWAGPPRTEDRAPPSRPRSQALLSKDAQTLSDALTRFSQRRKARQK
jgi:hypothetical protein